MFLLTKRVLMADYNAIKKVRICKLSSPKNNQKLGFKQLKYLTIYIHVKFYIFKNFSYNSFIAQFLCKTIRLYLQSIVVLLNNFTNNQPMLK